MRAKSHFRRGATVVELAAVSSVTFLLLIGMMVGGLGVFRYQQVARLARDASRWASVHGTQYAADTKNTAATATDVYQKAIVPNATGLDLSKLTYSVTWNTSNAPSRTIQVNNQPVTIANAVTVAVNYQWLPEAYIGGINMSS